MEERFYFRVLKFKLHAAAAAAAAGDFNFGLWFMERRTQPWEEKKPKDLACDVGNISRGGVGLLPCELDGQTGWVANFHSYFAATLIGKRSNLISNLTIYCISNAQLFFN